jgi:hypothetical protein
MPRHTGARPALDALALALFAALGVALTWPIARQLYTHIPGPYLDDNAMFLWNFWVTREALAAPDGDLFRTASVFAPGGVDLVLHSHAIANSLAGATVLGALPVVAAMNVTIVATFALNGFITYLLALRCTGDRRAALLAGVFFAGSPLFTAHLYGHFNYYTAWPLVLFVLLFLRARGHPSAMGAALAGGALALVAYVDYYYFIYAAVFAALAAALRAFRLDLVPHMPRRTRLDTALLVVAALGAVVTLAIAVTGGIVWQFGPIRVSLRSGINVRAVATAAFLWWVWRRRRVTLGRAPASPDAGGSAVPAAPWDEPAWRVLITTGATAVLLLTPLLLRAYALWRDGQYVTQPFVWRSAPRGIDAATLVAGNRFSTLYGDEVRTLYGWLGMQPLDDPAWLGLVPLLLIATRRAWWPDRTARELLVVIACFFVWALGPFLQVGGLDTGLPLPQILFRYVPVLSNARIPSHAIVMVYLGTALLLAVALSRMGAPRQRIAAGFAAAVVLADFSAMPLPMVPLEASRVYAHLASLPKGTVLDLPFGIRDGFGAEGRFEARTLYFQTIHGQPLASGYVARLPPAVRERYDASPAMRTILRLSAGDGETPAADPAAIARELHDTWQVRYIVVNDDLTPPLLRRFVETMPVTLLMDEGSRRLYLLQ